VENFSEDNLDIAEICYRMAWYMMRINDRSANPISLAERSVEVRTRLLGEEDQKTLLSIDILLLVLAKCNKLEMAEEIGRKLVDTQTRLHGEEAELTLISMGNLALVYHGMKK
jgi:glutamate synthase domain-containing protein 1